MTIHSDRSLAVSERFPLGNNGVIDRRSLPRETIDRIVDSDRRREVLRCVLAADEPVSVRRLVATLADAEYDPTVGTPIHQLRQRIHVSLCRTHLPLLAEHDIVRYDPAQNLVAPGEHASAFESLLELDSESSEQPIAARLE
ncbi:hypothetical protein BDK88_0811 [Natrinema hispanicum]|uniref:DUF7344 domain-containing protein n=1 Tax=Natrinema hispanicum TaxID=392421 RepID=A0A482Y9L1_9EURY|nr:hypothetical protein [Natrinema hispanicum]RZV11923.1 hypothetical protein BDK88_0811 [Natrinema hispanicum]